MTSPVKQSPSVRLGEKVSGLLRKVLPPGLTRLAFRAGYAVMNSWWVFTEPTSNGSKVLVTRGDEVLFVRLTYGIRDNWDLPGGTANHNEQPEQTAARELHEELGLSGELRLLGKWQFDGPGRKGILHGYQLEVAPGIEPVLDEIEIAELRWFKRDDLPARVASGTEAMIQALI